MLDGDCAFLDCPPDDPDLVGRLPRHPGRAAGRGHRRGGRRARSLKMRAEARARHGWIMDTYLLRSH